MTFEIVHKPTFTNQLLMLPLDKIKQIMQKAEQVLREDPHPHGDLKKKLVGYQGDIYRLRSGDFRVVYTYGEGWVALLGVDDRKDVYRGDKLVAGDTPPALDGMRDADSWLDLAPSPAARRTAIAPVQDTGLPVRLDPALLQQLHVPEACWAALEACETLDDLIEAQVPDAVRDRLFDILSTPNFDLVVGQPSFVTPDVDDLLRFKEGELLGFLLKLSPEQEKFVTWAADAAGPTLVKGGPGTGKSTVALYRVRTLLALLRVAGVVRPRILFTTYTNALVGYSQQLLRSLLGPDADLVEVRTADSLALAIACGTGQPPTLAEPSQLRALLREAIATASFGGNALQRRAQAQTLERLSPDYLLDEIGALIEGRALDTLDAYLQAPRTGRAIRLNATQRAAVWKAREALSALLAREHLRTWSQLRRLAAEIVAAGSGPASYDAVVIDEAQDLEPSVLRLLVGLCAAPNRLFITADANQSIYGSGFRWHDVHGSLQFKGRTGILRANYRSTREIGEAALSYLADGAVEEEALEPEYLHNGPEPSVRAVAATVDEAALLARFLPAAARSFRLGLGACAVLVPSERAGKALAGRLRYQQIDAVYMSSQDLDLGKNCVKIVPLKSAKGLEFPVVALAGFLDGPYPPVPKGTGEEEVREILARERRTLFVGMTRAMRALLVLLPAGAPSPLYGGFAPAHWNMGTQ